MIDLLLTIAAVIAIYRMAEIDRGEGLKWGATMFALCVLAGFLIHIPFVRTFVAIAITFGLMTFTKKTFY